MTLLTGLTFCAGTKTISPIISLLFRGGTLILSRFFSCAGAEHHCAISQLKVEYFEPRQFQALLIRCLGKARGAGERREK